MNAKVLFTSSRILAFAMIMMLLFAGGCAPQVTPTESPAQTTGVTNPAQQNPTPVGPAATATTSPATPAPVPTFGIPNPYPVPILPGQEVTKYQAIAQGADIPFVDMARDHTVIYSTLNGAAELLTPAQQKFSNTLDELVKDPLLLERQMLGGFTVVEQVQNDLPVGPYIIAVTKDNASNPVIALIGQTVRTNFPLIIRQLKFPEKDRPIAMISAVEMCLAWGEIQICAEVKTPPASWMTDALKSGIKNKGLTGDYAIDLTVPDMEGLEVLTKCMAGLQQPEPDYTPCKATTVVAPSLETIPPSTERIKGPYDYSIAALTVLESFTEQVYSDVDLTQPIEQINNVLQGTYQVREIYLTIDKPALNDDLRLTRVAFVSQGQATFYLPSVSGGQIAGTPRYGPAPDENHETVIANQWSNGCCYWKLFQCPWLIIRR